MADQVDQAISEKGRQGSFSGWFVAPASVVCDCCLPG
jgi:hypothetical protein